MRYRIYISSYLDNGIKNTSSIEVTTTPRLDSLMPIIQSELMNNHGEPREIGFTLTIERIA